MQNWIFLAPQKYTMLIPYSALRRQKNKKSIQLWILLMTYPTFPFWREQKYEKSHTFFEVCGHYHHQNISKKVCKFMYIFNFFMFVFCQTDFIMFKKYDDGHTFGFSKWYEFISQKFVKWMHFFHTFLLLFIFALSDTQSKSSKVVGQLFILVRYWFITILKAKLKKVWTYNGFKQ